jgi:hypothetical protein
MHRNPVKRGLATEPSERRWSSFNHWATGEIGAVELQSQWTATRRERGIIETHVSNASVQSHDMLSTLSREMLYTFALAEVLGRWGGRRWRRGGPFKRSLLEWGLGRVAQVSNPPPVWVPHVSRLRHGFQPSEQQSA